MGFGFGLMSVLFPIMFIMTFVVIMFVLLSSLHKEFRQKRFNRNAPQLKVSAGVVVKRTSVSHHNNFASTHYYVTFEVESGYRMEFAVDGPVYGMLAEGDVGSLTFKGSEFVDFVRK